MSRAFTDTEREEVQRRLRRIGLELFAEKGIRGVSIRALTSGAGIAQGGFYTFYRDKEDFIIDLMECRIREKLAALEARREESLEDPAGYIAELFYREGMHLKENRAFDHVASGTLDFFSRKKKDLTGRLGRHYRAYFERMIEYWRQSGLRVTADAEGLTALVGAAGVFFSGASLINGRFFETMYRGFCETEVRLFLRVDPC